MCPASLLSSSGVRAFFCSSEVCFLGCLPVYVLSLLFMHFFKRLCIMNVPNSACSLGMSKFSFSDQSYDLHGQVQECEDMANRCTMNVSAQIAFVYEVRMKSALKQKFYF